MKRMKRLGLILTLTLTFFMSGCGKGGRAEEEAGAKQNDDKENAVLEENFANVVYVSETGNDDAQGSREEPYGSVEKGLEAIASGRASTLYLLKGTYGPFALGAEHSGTAEAPVTIAACPGEEVKIVAPDADAGIYLCNVEHVVIDGFEVSQARYGISYESTEERGETPLENVVISNNTVHDIVGTHGIAVYARNYNAPVKNVMLEGNEVYNCRCDSSESTVLNGNIEGFTVCNNVIHDNNNIGIDMIGFEGNARKPGDVDPYEVDYVRKGKCFGNVVYNISSFNNQAYWTAEEDDEEGYAEYAEMNPGDPSLEEKGFYDLCADGIYVDGGQDIEIYDNFIYNCDIGIEVATEHSPKDDERFEVAGVEAHDNIIAGCTGWAGICFGGYDSDLGFTHDCVFRNNTLYENGAGIAAQRSFGNRIEDNLIVGGGSGLDVNDMGNEDEDYVNDNFFGCNYWIDTEGAEDFALLLDDIEEEEQAKQQIREMDAELNPEDGFASPIEGVGAGFSPAKESVEGYLALRSAQDGDGLEQAMKVLERIKAEGVGMEKLESVGGDLLAYLREELAKEGIENVRLEMMPAPVHDPEGLIRCCKGEEETFSEFQMDGQADMEKAAELPEGKVVQVSVCVRYEYWANSYIQGCVSGIPVSVR